MKNFYSTAACIFLAITISKAQPYFDVASVQKSSAESFLMNEENKIPLKLNWLAVNLNYPITLNKKNILITSPGYERFKFENQDPLLSEKFNSIYMPLTLLHTWKDTTWSAALTYIPKVSSYSPVHVNDNTFQQGGAIVFIHTVNDHFKYSFGGYYNQEFFGNFFLPLLGIEWKASERLHVFGLLPNDMTADYRINKALHLGFAFKGITTSFRYNPASHADYLKMEEGQLKLFADIYIAKNIVLNIEGGSIIARSYELKNKDSNPAHKFNARESGFFKAGLYYRMWL